MSVASKSASEPEQPVFLSSPFTFFFKCIVPLSFLAFGGFLLAGPLFLPVQVDPGTTSQPGNFAGYYLMAVVLLSVSGLFIWWNFTRLKRVTVHGQFLRVSNYRREIDIPLSLVQEVTATGHWFWSLTSPPYRVVVALKETTAFGERVVFIPGYYVKDVLRDLNRVIQGARARSK